MAPKLSALRAIRRRRHIRLPDSDAGNFRTIRRLMKLLGGLIVNVARDIFSGRIQHVERRKLVQIFMVQRPDHRLDYLLQMHEIVEQADGIDLLARQRHAHFVIVPVEVLAFAFIAAQIVRSGECFIHTDLVHAYPSAAPSGREATRAGYSASMKRETSARSCVVLYSGRDSRKILPYCMREIRLSRMAKIPRSVLDLIKRPKPCFSARTASGTWYSAKALRPSSWSARTRAATIGSLGTAKGSLSTITQESWSPGTSTPCQKLAVAKRTAPGVFLKRSRSTERGAVPCSSSGKSTRLRTRSNKSLICE